MAMVVRANKTSSELGGHIASYQSLATLYEVGFNHFWHAPSQDHAGDLIYFQGHSSPGNYARAYLEGRLSEEQLDGFRQEVSRDGLTSYPHPWLMPDFWQFPTVSLGIGGVTSIYQARFMKYLHARGLADTEGRKVWAFLGDGEMDEPESMGSTRPGRPRPSRQPDLGRQLQPPAPRRSGSRQRQDHPGARVRFPRRRLERDQGDLGLALGPAARRRRRRPAARRDGGVRRRRVPDVQVARRRLRARALLRPRPGAARPGLAHVRRGDLAAQPRRPRPAEGLRGLSRGGPPRGAAHGDPGQDDQGLRHGRLGRGPDDHPPGQEDDRGRAAAVPRPLRAAADRRPGPRRRVLQAARRLARDALLHECRAALGGSLPARRRRAEPLAVPGSSCSTPSSRAPASARSRPRWPSSVCWPRCSATSRSDLTSCRSCPTSRGPSGWRGCSARSASTPPSASSTSLRTRSS